MKSMEIDTKNGFHRFSSSNKKELVLSPYQTCPYSDTCPYKPNGAIICQGTNKNRSTYFYCRMYEVNEK